MAWFSPPVIPCPFKVLRREGLSPGKRQLQVSKEQSPKGQVPVHWISSTGSSPNAFIPPLKGVGFRLDIL
jgi:hypothetical protein